MKNDYSNYLYYRGEKSDPYAVTDFGKSFWWRIESYAFANNDDKERTMLSMTMVNYLKEHMWQGDEAHSDTTLTEMLKRADTMYNHGVWSRDYLCNKRFHYQQAVEYSKKD